MPSHTFKKDINCTRIEHICVFCAIIVSSMIYKLCYGFTETIILYASSKTDSMAVEHGR
jgi:hypothetical protein